MKKYMKCCISGILFIAGVFPLTLAAQPQAGNHCSGLTTATSYNPCSGISLQGEDKNQVYTYAISFMNVSDKSGCMDLFSQLYKGGEHCRGWVRPGKAYQLIVDSHYCAGDGKIYPDLLAITSLARGWNDDFIDMEITAVSVLKSRPISNMRCSEPQQTRALMEISPAGPSQPE